jgi:MoaA/NifB/PqqE/SkfB family radical SAM enzyme
MYEQNMKAMNALANQVYAANSIGEVMSFPEVITVAVSSICNYRCLMCAEWRKPVRQELSQEILAKVKPVLPFVNTLYVTGGEPFMYDKLDDLLQAGQEAGCHLQLVTNGSLLTDDNIQLVFKRQLQKLKISLDAAKPSTYKHIRGGNLDKVLRNISRVIETRNAYRLNYPYIELGFVAMRSNIAELPKFILMAKKLGVEVVYVSYMAVHHEDSFDESLFMHQELSDEWMTRSSEVAKQAGITVNLPPLFSVSGDVSQTEFRGRQDHCFEPWRNMFLWPDGKVSMCCGGGGDTGNLATGTFHDMWNHPRRVAARKLVNTAHPPKACKDCYTQKQNPNRIGTHISNQELQKCARQLLAAQDAERAAV